MNFGKTRKQIKDAIAASKPAAKPSFNFKTKKRAEGVVSLDNDTAKHLETLTKDRAVDLWKVYYIKKKHTDKQAKNYKEICNYLTQKYGIDIPKRGSK